MTSTRLAWGQSRVVFLHRLSLGDRRRLIVTSIGIWNEILLVLVWIHDTLPSRTPRWNLLDYRAGVHHFVFKVVVVGVLVRAGSSSRTTASGGGSGTATWLGLKVIAVFILKVVILLVLDIALLGSTAAGPLRAARSTWLRLALDGCGRCAAAARSHVWSRVCCHRTAREAEGDFRERLCW